jgi:murein DD-endopeptidase MepM/ murein hydrolase activator NlpD
MKLTPFVPISTYNASNPFGQYDPKYYPQTKHHIGSDYRVPVGTAIVAPCDGEMFKVAYNAARGNTGIYVFTFKGQEWGLELCHLRELPTKGRRKQGETIAYSGATGSASTGAHLHAVMHLGAMVTKNYTDLISEDAFVRLWREGRLVDPYLWFYQRI